MQPGLSVQKVLRLQFSGQGCLRRNRRAGRERTWRCKKRSSVVSLVDPPIRLISGRDAPLLSLNVFLSDVSNINMPYNIISESSSSLTVLLSDDIFL